jgi:hypothetical protein
MIVLGGWPGRVVLGTGRFGVRPDEFATLGDFDSPLEACVDPGDENTEFAWVIRSLPSSGTLVANDDGGMSHTGAADGTYVHPFGLYTWAPGGPGVYEGDTGFTTSFGTVTIAGGVGAADASGLQATITLPTVIAAGVGAASADGLAASIALATVISAGVGQATASGLAAQLGLGTTIACGVGEATASGLAASIAPTTVVAAGVGTATASGLEATITQGNTISAGVGTAEASGLQATIAVPTTIAAGVGSASASGLQAAISLPTVVAGSVGAASASGLQASIVTATVIAAGVGAAEALGLGAQITVPGATVISAEVGSADASGLAAYVGAPQTYADQPMTSASWSYLQTATLWALSTRDTWGGQVAHEPPVLFLCDYAQEAQRVTNARGDEFTSRLLIYTSLPGVKQGDMVLIGTSTERNPYAAGAQEVRAVTTWADTFKAEGYPDFRIAT